MNVDTHTYLSLFAGVGGLDLGLRIAIDGARCIGFCEREFAAIEVLENRIEEGSLEDAPIFTDVRSFPGELYRGRVAGIVAGFPCPDYSVAGKRAGIVGKHGQLWDDLAIVIRDVGPDWVFLENVPGIYVPHGGDAGSWSEARAVLPAGLWFVLGDLAALGFDAEWLCLRASDVGASHGRARWFCLAVRKGRGCGIGREPSRDERPGPHREARKGRGVRETGEGMANTDGSAGFRSESRPGERAVSPADGRSDRSLADACHGLVSQQGRGPEGRDGSGPAGARVAYPESPERWRPNDKDEHGRRTEEVGGSDGGIGTLGDPNQTGSQGRIECEYSADERSAGAAGDSELADTRRERNERRGEPGIMASAGGSAEVGEEERERRWNAIGDSMPIFAPGPSDPRWPAIIAEYPWLAPAISEEETERMLCTVADGSAASLACSRTDGLRACGNGVVALQVALAFTVLARRVRLNQ